jgi:succinate dehydrogenase/fumarate reductase cytochrome b subunit
MECQYDSRNETPRSKLRCIACAEYSKQFESLIMQLLVLFLPALLLYVFAYHMFIPVLQLFGRFDCNSTCRASILVLTVTSTTAMPLPVAVWLFGSSTSSMCAFT